MGVGTDWLLGLGQLNDMLSLGMHRDWKQWTVEWSGAQPGDTVLDVCCGSGDIAFLLREVVGEAGQVCAIRQLCVEMIEATHKSSFI